MSTSAGAPVADTTARYLPFGDWHTEPAANLTDRGYTSHKHNNMGSDDLGLIYMNARYYVPGIARFASADAIVPNPANPQSYNRYSYVRNNPLNFVDPTGHIGCDSENLYGTDQNDCAPDPGPENNGLPQGECEAYSTENCAPPRPDIPEGGIVGFVGFDVDDSELASYLNRLRAEIARGAWRIARNLARTINDMFPSWNLTAREAFLLVYGGKVIFEWTGEKRPYAAETQSANLIYVYDTRGDPGAVTNGSHWAIHEFGHAFAYAVGGVLADTGRFLRNPGVGRLDDKGLFYTGYAGGYISPRLWQQNKSSTANEQFADMFLGYMYGAWQRDPTRPGGLSGVGEAMSTFMNNNMSMWVYKGIYN